MKSIIIIFLLILTTLYAFAKDPDCAGIDRWPTKMAFVQLKNAGITDNNKVDFTKTKTIRLASEKIGDNLYHQIHLIKFTEKSGKIIEMITINDASNEECSMGKVEVLLISKRLEENRNSAQ
ncbi:MAG: hypothetical protein ACLPSL_13050 [Smithella sp.]